MSRQNLIDVIAGGTETSKAATTRFLDSLITIVQNEVVKGDAVKLTGFSTFEKATVATHTGRNLKTNVPVRIPSTHRPKFTSGTAFKGLVKD